MQRREPSTRFDDITARFRRLFDTPDLIELTPAVTLSFGRRRGHYPATLSAPGALPERRPGHVLRPSRSPAEAPAYFFTAAIGSRDATAGAGALASAFFPFPSGPNTHRPMNTAPSATSRRAV